MLIVEVARWYETGLMMEGSMRVRDIHDVDPGELASCLPRGRQLDLLVVCAPCQPFSAQNYKRGEGDIRQGLIFQAARFAEVLQPRVIFFENVSGLAASRTRPSADSEARLNKFPNRNCRRAFPRRCGGPFSPKAS